MTIEQQTTPLAEMPPLVELTTEQQIIRILDQLVKEKGENYVYPHAAVVDPDSQVTTMAGNCQYVECKTGDTYIFKLDTVSPEGTVEVLPEEELQPSCIIGHLLHRLGHSLHEFVGENDSGVGSLGYPFTNTLERVSQDFQEALSDLQGNQDKGMAWGEAVALFKEQVAA